MILTYSRVIPEEELLGRILGPDTVNGFVYVHAVFQIPDEGRTKADCLPLPLDEERIHRDEWGQLRVSF